MQIDPTITAIVERVHAASVKAVFEYAGAGSLAIFWLHSVAGSSRTVLEATDRYATSSLAELIGQEPQKSVSIDTAREMAARAYRRAMRLADGAAPCVGVACTATIATDRTKRGDHHCWVAVQNSATVRLYQLTLTKGARERLEEEALVSRLILHALAQTAGLDDPQLPGLLAGERVVASSEPAEDPVARLLAGDAASVLVHTDGRTEADEPVRGAILSGAFNPLHVGHERLAQVAAVVTDRPALFELPVVNADKPALGYAELDRRLAQFRGRYPVLLSRSRLFVEKADSYPGCVFVVGFDTAMRLVDPRYYGGGGERDAALDHIRAQGCSFLVAGRVVDDVFCTLADLTLPPGYADLFQGISEKLFRVDLSSSAIRDAMAGEV